MGLISLRGSIGTWVLILVLILGQAEAGFTQSNGNSTAERNYITWSDLKIDSGSLHVGDETSDHLILNSNKVIVVDKNGTGDSVTVQGAIDLVPENNAGRVKIHIRPGIYREKVHIPRNKPFISFIGDQNRASKTVITWHDKAADKLPNGKSVGTQNSASVSVESDYFCATDITFQNTIFAKPGVNGSQAVALRIASEKAVFYKVRFLGSQDTLLDESGSHYFYQCFVQGSVDFIFGNARSLYQECNIHVAGHGFAIAAHHRNFADEETGYSFVNCTVSGSGSLYLGRAWGNYSRIIYSHCDLDIHVRPGGWDDWRLPYRRNTVVFGEYECRGRGANRTRRAHWSKALNYSEARPFLDTSFISGEQWLRLD